MYVYSNGMEIDFFTKDKILIEVKFHREVSVKQQALFDSIKANKKLVITSFQDIDKLEQM